MNFDEMHLLPQLLTAVKGCGYSEPTPIQRETIPAVLQGKDVLGCAQTGTGKTAAFALPILQLLNSGRSQKGQKRPIRALILTPTRELALQIQENFVAYGKNLALRSTVIFGGVGQQPQVDQLKRGVDILVATPGRLNDLIGQGYISLRDLSIFVLDEADRMLDMGFIHDVRKVIALLPEKRQTLFFSATMPAEVEKLAMSILVSPVSVKVDPVSSTVDTIEQSLYMVDKPNKKHLLAELLQKPEVESALVFTRTKHGADRVVRELSRSGVKARAIHGDKSQNARQEALSSFKTGKIKVLIATDIAARGIDIAGLSHVFNYDLPNEPESYVHRIGRTGRAGHEGVAVSFCCIDEMKQLRDIEKLIGKTVPRKESRWPMQNLTETVKQPRPARGAKAAPEQKTVSEKKEKTENKKRAIKVKNNLAAAMPVEKRKEAKTGQESKTKKESTRSFANAKAQQADKAAERKAAQKAEKNAAKKQEAKLAKKESSPKGEILSQRIKREKGKGSPAAQQTPAMDKPLMRATPLTRTNTLQTSSGISLLPFLEEEKETKRKTITEEPKISYEEFMKKQTRQPSRLFTGSDRR